MRYETMSNTFWLTEMKISALNIYCILIKLHVTEIYVNRLNAYEAQLKWKRRVDSKLSTQPAFTDSKSIVDTPGQ